MTTTTPLRDDFELTVTLTNKALNTPWGYTRSEENPCVCIADHGALTHLSEAFDMLDNKLSIRETIDWLKSKGYNISKTGLHRLWRSKRGKNTPRDHEAKLKKRREKYAMKIKNLPQEEKELREKRKRLADEKRKFAALQKSLEQQKQKEKEIQEKEQEVKELKEAEKQLKNVSKPAIVNTSEHVPEERIKKIAEEDGREVIFEPNPGPQYEFLASSELEILYGGSAGGGKSYALLADPMRYFGNKNCNALLLRRTNDELRELKWQSKKLYPQVFKDARFSEKDSEWRFPSGARLWMSYLDRDDDVLRYQGQAFTWVGFDELTQYPSPLPWDYLRSRLRSTDPELKDSLSMRACVDDGEVLTETGWKHISDVQEGEFVYSLETDGNLILKPVHTTVKYLVNEELVRVKKKNLYLSMTQDHRVVYRTNEKGLYKIDRWNKVQTKSVGIARTSSNYNLGNGWNGPVDPEFLGLYIAEGSFGKSKKYDYKVIITQNKIENHPFVKMVLDNTGLNYCYSKNGDFQITSKKLWEYVKQFGKSYDKHFPRDFLNNATYDQLDKAFKAYAIGDGHWQSDSSCTLVTTSKQLKDDLCEIGIKLGYKVQIKYLKSNNPNHRDRYNIYFCSKGKDTKIDKNPLDRNDVSLEKYNGYVYCIGVQDTENFVLRQNGFVWISGNTTNPGGPGHGWVKKMFIDPAPPNTAFWARNLDTGETLIDPDTGLPLFQRKFIPAKLVDNPYLWKDGIYKRNLLSLSDGKKAQLLDGDWTIADGAAFPEFRVSKHVIKPFEIPENWTRFRAADYGYSSFSCVLWFAIDPHTDQLVVYRELYISKATGEKLADLVLDLERGERIQYGVLDSSVWHKRGEGPSIAEVMIGRGCRWKPSDRSAGSRVAGKNRLHELLKINDETEKPDIIFFDTCRQVISDLQVIPTHPDGEDDIDPRYKNDHSYDALRYGIMSRPRSVPWFMQNQGYRVVGTSDRVFGY